MGVPKPYNPSMKHLVSQADDDWGDPEKNLAAMIRYRIGIEFDNALWGITPGLESELITIQGPIKNRKSTLLSNLIINWAVQLIEKETNYWICVDSLESGMSPKAYRDQIISIIATRLLISEFFGMDRTQWPQAAEILQHEDLKEQLIISKKFLRFYPRRTPAQQKAIETAKQIAASLPISVFGASRVQGNTRDLEKSVYRWEQLFQGTYPEEEYVDREHRIFAVDHVQQYNTGGGGDYSNLEKVTTEISDFVAGYTGTVFAALSQVSLTSIRDYESGSGKMRAKGGDKLAAESNLVLLVRYDKELDPSAMIIAASEGRDETPPTVRQEIQPSSGAFLRLAQPVIHTQEGEPPF